MNKILFLCIAFFLCSLLAACKKDPPRLSRSHYKLVDSLVQQRRAILREELDSLCDIRFATEIDQATDSIYQERMAKIIKKIKADAKQD